MHTSRQAALHKGLLLVIFLLLLAGGAAVGFFVLRAPARPDFHALGGTALVYEVAAPGADEPKLDEALHKALVETLQRRMDEAGLRQVVVASVGLGMVEFRIARLEKHQQDIEQVKDLISRTGRLEFRILANEVDDAMGQGAAKRVIEDAKDLPDRALNGLPPPSPVQGNDPGRPLVFDVSLANGHKSKVSYSWVELGPAERKALRLDNAAAEDPTRNEIWLQARGQINQAFRLNEAPGHRKLLHGALFFARRCEDRNLPEIERQNKKYEYFVLARDPELDPNDPTGNTKTRKMDGRFLTEVAQVQMGDQRSAVSFRLDAEGAPLFGQLTKKNVPTANGPDEIKRHLAIILDDQVLSAPTINSEIRDRGQISGHFTQKEIDHLTSILRAGALPAKLKAQPVSETTVAPAPK